MPQVCYDIPICPKQMQVCLVKKTKSNKRSETLVIVKMHRLSQKLLSQTICIGCHRNVCHRQYAQVVPETLVIDNMHRLSHKLLSQTICIGFPIKSSCVLINVTEYRRCDQKWTIQRNWQHWAYKTQHEDKQNKQYTTICVGYHYAK